VEALVPTTRIQPVQLVLRQQCFHRIDAPKRLRLLVQPPTTSRDLTIIRNQAFVGGLKTIFALRELCSVALFGMQLVCVHGIGLRQKDIAGAMQTLMTMWNLVSIAGPPALKILQARVHQAVIDYRMASPRWCAWLGCVVSDDDAPRQGAPEDRHPGASGTMANCQQFQDRMGVRQDPLVGSRQVQVNSKCATGAIEKGTRAFALQMVFSECVTGTDPDLKTTGGDALE
jgi:hypothetical protein